MSATATSRLLAPIALVAALFTGACSDAESTGPEPVAPAAAAASVHSFGSVFAGTVMIPLGDIVTDCLAEPVEVHFHGRFRVMLQQTGDGLRSVQSVQMNEMGSYAVGLESGTTYRVAGTSTDRFASGTLQGGNGATTATVAGFQKYVGAGDAANFTVRSDFKLTMNPDGTMAVERVSSEASCS